MSEVRRAVPVRARTRSTPRPFSGAAVGPDPERPRPPEAGDPSSSTTVRARSRRTENVTDAKYSRTRRRALRFGPISIRADVVGAVRLGAAAAAAVLAITSTGSAVIVAFALAVALADRRSALAVGFVVVAGAVRYGSTDLDDWAGIQSVLGTGVEVGPITGAVSAWLVIAAAVLAARAVPHAAVFGAKLDRVIPSVGLGAVAAAVSAGPGPDGQWWIRFVATVVVAALAFFVCSDSIPALARRRHDLSVVAAIAAVLTAAWPVGDDGPPSHLAVDAVGLAVSAVGFVAAFVIWRMRHGRFFGRWSGLGFAAACLAAGLVLIFQESSDLHAAGLLVAVGAVIAVVCRRPAGLVALVPGAAAAVEAFAGADHPTQAAAGAAVAALMLAAATLPSPDADRDHAAPVTFAGWRNGATLAAVVFAVVPVWGWSDADLGGAYNVGVAAAAATAGAVAVAAILRTGGTRRAATLPTRR